MDPEIRKRLKWVELFRITGSASLVCLRCGISPPTLRKWVRRYEQFGLEGLRPQSLWPKTSPQFKLTDEVLVWIRELRNQRFGHRRMQCELKRLHGFSLALGSIHKALHLLGLPHLKPAKRDRRASRIRRYQQKTPGERVQVDNGKIGPKLYQYTAIDDCTRMQVVRLYSHKTAASTLACLEQMVSAFPFPVQRVQTDRAEEFFATAVQYWLMDQRIKFRPIRPYSPHLNGKVERVQRTDREEFYARTDLKASRLDERVAEWEEFYNRAREHGSLLYKTPAQRWEALREATPTSAQVRSLYDPKKERLRVQDYRLDKQNLAEQRSR